MRTEQKTNIKNSIGRLVLVGLSVLVQLYWIVQLFFHLSSYSPIISLLSSVVALAVCLMIYGRRTNAAIKIPWIMLILVWPVVGLCLYALMGRRNTTKRMRERFEVIDASLEGTLRQADDVIPALEQIDYGTANVFRYLWKTPGYPVYRNTDVTFYPEASEGFEAQLRDLEQAQHFIFMEYYAIEEASAFARLKEVLARKAGEGVEVRVFYDDIGSIGFINIDFIHRMEEAGVRCQVFNPVVPILNIFMNNRDHRKFTVIDGKVGYTGGYNLADEYFNITHPYGYWKDSGVRLEGDAVRSLTVLFLEMWNLRQRTDADYYRYLPQISYRAREQGFVAVYGDSPLDLEHVGETVYMNLVKNAKHSVWFTTPYLIITDEMKRELRQAAKRGVDVRIITPGIPDKKMVYQVTRSYYEELAEAGVRIYEYTPGFLHSKQCIADGEIAVVGTINLDYRSLYLHFEDAVLFYRCSCIEEIREDFVRIMKESAEVTEQYSEFRKNGLMLWQLFLRLCSPLL
ncbi:MAG: cardiolipin synthase [Eubacteriales bacterium]|nr:cardiolipin synthase [Eubacteriales bacterium]